MAEAHYAQIAPWMFCGPISGAASIQVSACSPNFLIQEGIDDWGGFASEILKEGIRWEAGYIIPSDKPGPRSGARREGAAKVPCSRYVKRRYSGRPEELFR